MNNKTMRRALRGAFCALLYTALALVVSGCANSPAPPVVSAPVNNPAPVNTPAPADGLSLDEGIAQIAAALEAGLPEGTRIAVVNFESPSAYFSDYVLEELQAVLENHKRLLVTERSKLELLRNEINFQMSEEVDENSAVFIGHWLGAQVIVTGRLTELGTRYRCRFNATDVEKAVRLVAPGADIRKNDADIAFMLPKEVPAALPSRVPAKPDPALAVAYFNSGLAHYEAKRYAQAVADFTRALEVKPDDEASLRYRAYAYYYLKDYDKSITDMSSLIRMRPDNAENYLTRSAA
jgi:tetratricopeptide (TPR) repeat protein